MALMSTGVSIDELVQNRFQEVEEGWREKMYRQGECDMLPKKNASMKGFLGLNEQTEKPYVLFQLCQSKWIYM